jgi:SulP family sulfate permease
MPALLTFEGAGHLLVGPVTSAGGGIGGTANAVRAALGRLLGIGIPELRVALVPGLMLGVLVSIDTLKTCLMLDVLTRSRHDSDRELVAQGLGNVASAVVGGAPGTGIVSASLVNVHGGARGRLSAVLAGVFALAVLVGLGPLIAWLPVPALAAIVCLMAARMFQREALVLLRERQTLLEFAVVVAVICVSMAVNLAAAAAAGVAVSFVLFVREQARAPLVRRIAHGDAVFSRRRRSAHEQEILNRLGGDTVIAELQGSLFFGSAERLYRALEPQLARCSQVVLDLSRIRSVDVTAATTLRQIAARLGDRGARLVLAEPPGGRAGKQLGIYIAHLGLDRPPHEVLVLPHLDEALDWCEQQVLARANFARAIETPLALAEMTIFRDLPPEALRALEAEVRERALSPGEQLFAAGDPGTELFLVRSGAVRILLPLAGGKGDVLDTVGRGELFGEMGFTDHAPRSADAFAGSETRLYALSRDGLARANAACTGIEATVIARLAHVLVARLRVADQDRRALKEV